MATDLACSAPRSPGLQDLPDELLLQVFMHLADVGPSYESGRDPWFLSQMPFRTMDRDDLPHPGLRAYPFLGQVCKRWNALIQTPIAQTMLWDKLVVDFGHELVTAIHTPLKWSNLRPSAEDFAQALSTTTLSVQKIMAFVQQRKHVITSLSLCNSEGFWGEEGEYLTLNNKHSFQASHLGFCLGMLHGRLQELQLFCCNDLISADSGMWTSIPACTSLRTLVVEGVNCRIGSKLLAHLARLPQLEALTITGEEHMGQWITGMDCIPPEWSGLTSLKSLTLRNHQLLDTVPLGLMALPHLTFLDLSNNANMALAGVAQMTRLRALCLQNNDLCQAPGAGSSVSVMARRMLPDLAPLTSSLTALSLANNRFTRLPACLAKLSRLRVLDLSGNKELAVPAPVTGMFSSSLPEIAIVDFRGVHVEKEDSSYWGPEKCMTMRNLAAVAKMLKRRKYATRVLLDTQ